MNKFLKGLIDPRSTIPDVKKFSETTQDGKCTKCGGSQFKVKRSRDHKIAMGVLAPKTPLRCITCGTEYRRG